VRQNAAIQFKNTVAKYWNKRGGYYISDDEKEHLKKQILSKSAFSEKNILVYRQVAVAVAKVARFDWPKKWPTLFPATLEVISKGSEVQVIRALHLLLEVLRELSSRRIFMLRKAFHKAAGPLLDFLRPAWFKTTQQLISAVSQGNFQQAKAMSERSLQLLRCLNVLVAYGIAKLNDSKHARGLFEGFLQISKLLLPKCRDQQQKQHALANAFRTMVLVIGSTIIGCIKRHPIGFAGFLKPFAQFYAESLTKPFSSNRELIFEKQTTQAITFFSTILSSPQYTKFGEAVAIVFNASVGFQADPKAAERARNILREIFGPKFVVTLANITLYRLMMLQPSEIEEWNSDGEEYFLEVENVRYDEHPGKAAENLFGRLTSVFPDIICPMLFEALKKLIANKMANSTLENALTKSALYQALGAVSFIVSERLEKQHRAPFEEWYKKALLRDAVSGGIVASSSDRKNEGIIVRARAVWCLGEWVDQVKPQMRPSAYSIVSSALKSTDAVVRLMGANCLQSLVNDFAFKDGLEGYCREFLQGHVAQLLGLITDCRTLQARQKVAETLRIIVEAVGTYVKPIVAMLMKFLPELWKRCGDPDELRPIIIMILKAIVSALEWESVRLHPFLMTVLHHSLDPRANRAYLIEFAMELWHEILQNTPSLSQDLTNLFAAWPHHVTTGIDIMMASLPVVNSYILLATPAFLNKHGDLLKNSLCRLFADVRDEGRVMVVKNIEHLAERLPCQFTKVMEPMISTIIKALLDSAAAASGERKNNAPRGVVVGISNDKTLRVYSRLLTRLLFQDTKGIIDLIGKQVAGSNEKVVQVLGTIIGIWLDRLGDSWELYKRRVAALAMLKCLMDIPSDRLVGAHLAAVLAYCGGVVAEEAAGETKNYIPDFSAVRQIPEKQRIESHRKLILISNDPALKIKVRGATIEALKKISNRLGQQKFGQLWNSIDKLIKAPFS